jgi:DNA modification methylase
LSKKGHNFFHKTETTNSNLIVDRNKTDIGYPKTLIEHIKVMNNLSKDKAGLHPTQKPIELMEYLIKTYTNESDTSVRSFTMGSGSTGVACKNLNKRFYWYRIRSRIF